MGGGTGDGIRAGLLVSVTALSYWFSGLFLLFGAIPLWVRAPWRRSAWRPLGLAALVTALCCGPFVWALVQGWSSLPGVQREPEAWMDHGVSGIDGAGRGLFSLNMVIEQSSWPLWPFWRGDGDPSDLRLPLSALGLLGVGLLSRWRGEASLWRWLLVGLLGWGLLLGPYLRDGQGNLMGPPLPYLLLFDHLPFFDRLWWPSRAMPLVLAALAVLSAAGVEGLGRRFRLRSFWLTIPALGLLLLDVGLRNPYSPIPGARGRPFRSSLYEGLDGALITTPVSGASEDGRHALWLQVFHGLPISGGLGDHIEGHRPAGYDEFIERNGILRALARLGRGEEAGGRVQVADVAALLEAGFRFVVVDPSLYHPGREGPWTRAYSTLLAATFGPPSREAEQGAVWAIHPLECDVLLPIIEPPEQAAELGGHHWRMPRR